MAVEPLKSDFGSLLIRCRRIGEKELKDVAESKRKRYERLVEHLPGKYFFFGFNQDGQITYLSRSVKDITGFEAKEIVGKKWQEIVDLQREENRNLEDRVRRSSLVRICRAIMRLFSTHVESHASLKFLIIP